MKVEYVSFDPGKSTGVAQWDVQANLTTIPVDMDQKELDVFLQGLEADPPKKFIYEEWNLWKNRNKQGDKQVTVRVIGQITAFARRYNIELVPSRQGNKEIAAMWSGMEIPKDHMPNWQSAFLHGYYHLHQIGLIRARVLDQG